MAVKSLTLKLPNVFMLMPGYPYIYFAEFDVLFRVSNPRSQVEKIFLELDLFPIERFYFYGIIYILDKILGLLVIKA